VQDNGKGFRTGRTRGLGLLGMEERVSRLGGRMRLRSEVGRGTTLTVELPL
jgi:signal transduction histidine kinase